MRRIVLAATVGIAALSSGAGMAWAQSAPELRIGRSVDGVLNESDPQGGSEDTGQYRYDDYKIQARAGQRLEATMRSDAFDTYLQVFKAGEEGDGSSALAEDDDGLNDGTNSRLRWIAPESGFYTLRARTLSGLDGGAYSLSLAQRPPAPRAPRPTGIRLGQTIDGALTERDPEADDDAGRYDAYVFRAGEGQRVAIGLNSDAFDPMLRVGRMQSGSFVELETNDDGAGRGLNSYMVFTAPASGEYIVRATPLGSDGLGAYSISLEAAPPPLQAASIAIGDTVQGELSASDGVNDEGARADAYTFQAKPGQRIDVTMTSDAMDSYLELYDAKGEIIDQDDDGAGGGPNARLIATLTDGGTYTIQARSTGDGNTGAYTLKLAEAAPEPRAIPLTFGAAAVQGEIKDDGARDDDGRGYATYSFTGEQGHRVRVVMRSGDFDTFLQIGRPGGTFEALSSDDDGLGEGTDSRLTYILPETGEYIIRASPLGSQEKGLYSIELTDKGPQPEPGSILIGATARGTLDDNDGIADDGVFFDAYRITVAEGDKLNVTLVSNDFDAYIDIGRDKDGTWESVVSDDDSLSDTHAKVEWTVEEAGTYIIRARSFAQGETGSYALTVERRP